MIRLVCSKLCTTQGSFLRKRSLGMGTGKTYLNLGVGLLGVEADADGEEVVGVAAARELHAARLVRRVYHRKLK